MSERNDTPIVRIGEDGTPATDTLNVAEGTGVEHASVLRLVRENLDDFEEFGRVGFEIRPFDTAGGRQERQVAVLNEEQATLLLTYMRNSETVRTFKKNLVRAFWELRRTAPTTNAHPLEGPELLAAAVLESQKMIEQRDARIYQLEEKVNADAPKVGYIDQYVTDADLLSFSTVASTNDVTEKWLREVLIERDWIYSQSDSRWSEKEQKKKHRNRYSEKAPYKRYFRRIEVHDAPRFRGTEVMHTLKITPRGAEAIGRLVSKVRAA